MSESSQSNGKPLIDVEHLKQYFRVRSGVFVNRTVGFVHAVDDVTFTLTEGETLGLVGESGCGKTTLARTIMRLLDPSEGTIRFRGEDISDIGQRKLLVPARKSNTPPIPTATLTPASPSAARFRSIQTT